MRRQADRNRKLYEYFIKENDKHGSTYADVAKLFHVSPSRAWRIVDAERKRIERKRNHDG